MQLDLADVKTNRSTNKTLTRHRRNLFMEFVQSLTGLVGMVIPCCYGSGFQGLVLCMYLEMAKNVLKLCILIPLDLCKIYKEQFGFIFRNGLVLSAADRR